MDPSSIEDVAGWHCTYTDSGSYIICKSLTFQEPHWGDGVRHSPLKWFAKMHESTDSGGHVHMHQPWWSTFTSQKTAMATRHWPKTRSWWRISVHFWQQHQVRTCQNTQQEKLKSQLSCLCALQLARLKTCVATKAFIAERRCLSFFERVHMKQLHHMLQCPIITKFLSKKWTFYAKQCPFLFHQPRYPDIPDNSRGVSWDPSKHLPAKKGARPGRLVPNGLHRRVPPTYPAVRCQSQLRKPFFPPFWHIPFVGEFFGLEGWLGILWEMSITIVFAPVFVESLTS